MNQRLTNVLTASVLGLIVIAVLRMVLRESLTIVERMDRLAKEQAARHAYGPLTVVEPRDGESAEVVYGNDATSAPAEIVNHRFAPGTRAWDDDQLGRHIDPLDETVDDPWSADGTLHSPFFPARGGHVESDL